MHRTALLLLFLPVSSFAQVVITEVMYDLPGSDTGREWIEVYNTGETAVDLSVYKFFEANTNHKIATTTIGQNTQLAPGEAVVIADVPSKFLADWPSFVGALFDSSFSLSNSGELLVIKDAEGNTTDSLTYDVALGGAGDGNTLQKGSSGWTAAPAAPGVYEGGTPSAQSAPAPPSPGAATPSATPPPPNVLWKEPPPRLSVKASGPVTVIAGADTSFEGAAFGLEKEPLPHARFTWNFGDGAGAEGKRVTHRFLIPGDYIVYMDAASGDLSVGDRLVVKVIPSPISISAAVPGESGYVTLANGAAADIDISSWILEGRGGRFIFPRNTYLSSKKEVAFPNVVTRLQFKEETEIVLLYPNALFAAAPTAPAPEEAPVPKARNPASPAVVVENRTPPTLTQVSDAATSEEAGVSDEATHEARALAAASSGEEGAWKWIIALGALLAIAAVGAYILGKEKESGSGYTIIEEKETLG